MSVTLLVCSRSLNPAAYKVELRCATACLALKAMANDADSMQKAISSCEALFLLLLHRVNTKHRFTQQRRSLCIACSSWLSSLHTLPPFSSIAKTDACLPPQLFNWQLQKAKTSVDTLDRQLSLSTLSSARQDVDAPAHHAFHAADLRGGAHSTRPDPAACATADISDITCRQLQSWTEQGP